MIDNAGFHSTKNIQIPDNIFLLNIPSYSLELNPCEQIWRYIKSKYNNQIFDNMEFLKRWLHEMVNQMGTGLIKLITGNHHYLSAFDDVFYDLIGIKSYAKCFNSNEYDVLAWNYQICGREMNKQLRLYHRGATDDLETVITHAIDTRSI